MPQPLDALSNDIEKWIGTSTSEFERLLVDSGDVWVLKFIDARFLGGFLTTQQLTVSATPGFTWGDAVYVTPLSYPYSTMMYGRAGILGHIPWPVDGLTARRAYDAHSPHGLALYQEWIKYSTRTFRLLTTTIHANLANRLLRNAFRARFRIDVVHFAPDQLNSIYVDRFHDRWLAVTDWTYSGIQLPGTPPKRTDVVKDCQWVAIVGEQFEQTPLNIQYNHLFRPYLTAPHATLKPSPTLVNDLRTAYANRNVIIIDP
jgi:hypothetical protein